ncbi:hypothetical protein [Methylococcus geothermalis]|nr:hypothetical protein [Methylococcus geothermalis]
MTTKPAALDTYLLEAALEPFRLIGADLGEEDDRLESAFDRT